MELSNVPAPAVSTTRLRLAQGLVLLFHITGFLGLAFSQDKAFYLKYTPLTLLLSAGLLAVFQPERGLLFWLFVVQAFLLGLVAEVIGTNTGLLFGHYTYGATLGPQYMGAPWLIGLNWVITTYLAGTLAAYLRVANLGARAGGRGPDGGLRPVRGAGGQPLRLLALDGQHHPAAQLP
ncbi:MAG: carotenoid biosynthesis protein [Hymenobacter sp.]